MRDSVVSLRRVSLTISFTLSLSFDKLKSIEPSSEMRFDYSLVLTEVQFLLLIKLIGFISLLKSRILDERSKNGCIPFKGAKSLPGGDGERFVAVPKVLS